VSLRGLGAAPGTSLRDTHWKAGNRLVTPEGTPIRADAMVQDQVWTVFPQGAGNPADSQALLIKTRADLLRLPDDRMKWTVDGVICYSKLCTHAGCPLAIYRPSTKSLFCPCHQSQFNILNGGKPFFGPAARALPQLPIRVDEEGYFVAEGGFSAPVGPAYWERS
jgi:ubiquinol-cytochrome c reductase iron-sulfur subunit